MLSELSSRLSDTVAALAPAVVRVKGHRRHVASGIAWTEDHVVTTRHGLGRAREVPVLLHGERETTGVVVGRDRATDLALLRLRGGAVPVVTWADTDHLAVGQIVLALGRPRRHVSALWGIVGSLGGAWETGLGGRIHRWIDVDASLRWGFSGGPLVDAEGRVIGLNSAALTRAGTTLPTETVRSVVERLLGGGAGGGAYLGIGAQPVGLPAALAEETGQGEGLLISAVEQDSPAEQGGVLLGDTLLALGGEPTTSVSDVAHLLAARSSGEPVTLRLVRAGQIIEREVALGGR